MEALRGRSRSKVLKMPPKKPTKNRVRLLLRPSVIFVPSLTSTDSSISWRNILVDIQANLQSHSLIVLAALEEPHHMGKKKAYQDSFGAAIEKSIPQFTNAVGFYAGVRLIQDGHISFENLFIAIICTMITSQQIGNASTFFSSISRGKTAAANVRSSAYNMCFTQVE